MEKDILQLVSPKKCHVKTEPDVQVMRDETVESAMNHERYVPREE